MKKLRQSGELFGITKWRVILQTKQNKNFDSDTKNRFKNNYRAFGKKKFIRNNFTA
uniref:Uncharacterized protein n=1 Tax=Octopus bimaculoides TaxID=37653 RepID=A0A0L8GNX8_OCTBM